jgi:hypothetical protein
MDGQSVKTTERGGTRGFDGHKRVKGRKRHILIDTYENVCFGAFATPAGRGNDTVTYMSVRRLRSRPVVTIDVRQIVGSFVLKLHAKTARQIQMGLKLLF